MRFGVYLPNYGPYSEPTRLVELAVAADRAGWDGFFLWDHLWFGDGARVCDSWTVLCAVAQATSRIQLGPLITPLARRRPAKVAKEATTLAELSGGRLILGLGLGLPWDFEPFGEDADPKVRGDALDEHLQVLRALWNGSIEDRVGGSHYSAQPVQPSDQGERGREPVPVTFRPLMREVGRIRLWGAGRATSNERPFRRAATLDGVAPIAERYRPGVGLGPDELADVVERVQRHGATRDGFDVVAISSLHGAGENAEDLLRRYERAGATWWLQDLHHEHLSPAEAMRFVQQPPAAMRLSG